MKADKLYLGNIITMADHKLRAEALTVKDGLIQYVGDEAIARSMCDEHTEIIDLRGSTIYPGFMEAHCHPVAAGQMLDKSYTADISAGQNLEEYVALMAEFIAKYPEKKSYSGNGFMERDVKPTAAMLDTIGTDKPIMIVTTDGHSAWLNTKAMELHHIDREAVKLYGEDCVRVDENGDPTGYISEAPLFDIRKRSRLTPEDGAQFLFNAQEFFFSKGYTAIYDAGLELVDKEAENLYAAATATGRYKLRTYVGSMVDENCTDIPAAIKHIAEKQQRCNNEYFKIIGVKTFTDGVIEAHTGLLMEDYNDQPGYKGVARLHDHEKLVELYSLAAENGMNVHVHTVGDGAIHCNLDAMEEAAAKTGLMDARNALAHLQLVNPQDIKRFADLNVIAVTAPLWTPKHPDYFVQEIEYVGRERAEHAYPIKSFIDAGAATVFHTDFPISRTVSIPEAIYSAVTRKKPGAADDTVRHSNEFIDRYQAIKAMTRNVAYMWHEEDRLGTLEVGKVANMSVFSKDFLTDALEEIADAKTVCTIVDGEIVYRG